MIDYIHEAIDLILIALGWGFAGFYRAKYEDARRKRRVVRVAKSEHRKNPYKWPDSIDPEPAAKD